MELYMKVLILLSEAYFRYKKGFKEACLTNGCADVKFFKIGIYSHEIFGLQKAAYKVGIKNYEAKYYDNLVKRMEITIETFKPDLVLTIVDFADVTEYLQKKLIGFFEKNKVYVWLLDSIKTMHIEKELLHHFDKLYVFEYNDLAYIENNYFNLKNVEFLPFGCDSQIFCQNKVSADDYRPIDISFVGVASAKRIKVLNKIAEYCQKENKKMEIYGHFWHNAHWYQKILGALKFKNKYPALFPYIHNMFITPEFAENLYRKSKICINIHQEVHLGPNPRTFEILGNGNFELCDNQDFTGIDLVNERDLIIYDSKNLNELIELIKYYLAVPEKRYEIGMSGMKITRKMYTFNSNIKQIFNDFLKCE